MAVVDVKGLSCRLKDGTMLLDGIDFEVQPGECVLLCGRSGMGKTTITKCLNGLVPVFEPAVEREGFVSVAGVDPAKCEMYELARRVGSVFQNPKSQFFNLTSNDELAFGLEVAGVEVDEIERNVRRAVDDLGICSLLDRDVMTMSGGQRQSLVFASVDVVDPDVYVLDEPTANLDEDATRALRNEIAAVLARGKTVIVAEHRLHFLAGLVDRALVVECGRIVACYTSDELRALPRAEREALGLRAFNLEELAVLDSLEDAVRDAEDPVLEQGISVRGLSVRKGDSRILESVSLDVARGAVLGIVGANGSGKTTLLRALAGLERSVDGTVSLDGVPLSRKRRTRACSMVMQDVNHQLFADSVWAECELSVLAKGPEGTAAIEEVLSELGLSGFEERHPMALSGGQKQRLAVACALLAERRVLLLDEPTSGLDLEHMIEVSELVRSVAQRGVSVVVVTHDGEFLQRACDSVFRVG